MVRSELVASPSKPNTVLKKIKPWIPSIAMLPVMIYFVYNQGRFMFIDYVNLLIHEGGHGIFSLFGKFIYTLGGTLTQVIIPAMFVVYYGMIRKKIMMQVFLVWLGENLINISIYAADARAHKLSLLGGNRVYHDWTYLLNQINLLQCDQEIGLLFYLSGISVFIISFLMPLFMKPYKQAKINPEL